MTEVKDARAVGQRVEALLAELSGLGDSRARERAEALLRALMEFYGAGLARLLEIVDEDGEAAARLFDRFGDDPLVSGLLILHGLHPQGVEERVGRALERVRPYLGSHGGDVELLGVEDGVARLRLEGSCHGCPSSSVTMRLAVERAIEEVAPDVVRIDVEGLAAPSPGPLLQITSRPSGASGESASREDGWIEVDGAAALGAGEVRAVDGGGFAAIVCRCGESLYAYRDACAFCGASLRDGLLVDGALACLACGHRYDVRAAGRCVEASGLHLDPLPLLTEGATVRLAVPVAAA